MAATRSKGARGGRPPGRRNASYETSRAALLTSASTHLITDGHARASFRELAEAVGVSVATLRHYFDSRETLLAAVLEHTLTRGVPFLHVVAAGTLQPTLRASVEWFVELLGTGLARGVAAIHSFSLSEGLGDEVVGPAYVRHVLEPTLQSLEARLERHIARGDMRRCNTRHAALQLVSPLLLARLHQGPLGGASCRPLDERALAHDVVESFLRTYEVQDG